jgi:hypothetical protein
MNKISSILNCSYKIQPLKRSKGNLLKLTSGILFNCNKKPTKNIDSHNIPDYPKDK